MKAGRRRCLGPVTISDNSTKHGDKEIDQAAILVERLPLWARLAKTVCCLMCKEVLAAFDATTLVARNNQVAPEKAIRPFDANREGFVLSEGVGVQNACVVMGAILETGFAALQLAPGYNSFMPLAMESN